MALEAATNDNVFRQLLEDPPDPSRISAERMEVAEKITWKEVLFTLHPTVDDQEKRADIILYLQTIITNSFEGIQVFPYGSVPLKTYLGDGDIDLTIICKPDIIYSLAEGIYALLKNEEQNIYAEHTVKETKMIGAEVKLVRCKVEDIPIDISFNQLGGLSAVCFLEQVDRLVNKNHLFKVSVLLIKAWCHYECRILGAYHGLLATYALEALVLFIFQLFGSSLNGPFAVLYRFLDYYGKFDWNNYCISLDGPVLTSSLPNLVVTDRGNNRAELLLSDEDLRFCSDLFAASTYSINHDMRIFAVMHLNIIDPLKENNNLGRSVNKANSVRIRAAFNYGARSLARILQLPSESISDEIKMFFECTMMKHRCSGAELETLSSLALSEEDFDLKSVEGDTDDVVKDVEGARPGSDLSNPLTDRSLNEYMDMESVENSNFVDLKGDYASLARGLAHGRCTLGYSATIPALSTPPPTIAQFNEMLWTVAGQFVYPENSYSRGTGTFIPNVDSISYRERFSRHRLGNLMQEPSAELQINRDNHIQTSDEFSPRPSQKDNTKGEEEDVVEGRIPDKSINLHSESEFPPLN